VVMENSWKINVEKRRHPDLDTGMYFHFLKIVKMPGVYAVGKATAENLSME